MKKKDLDEAYLEFMNKMKWYYKDEKFDLTYYINKKYAGCYNDSVDDLIAKVYCPSVYVPNVPYIYKDIVSRKKWEMNSDEELDLVNILHTISNSEKMNYENYDREFLEKCTSLATLYSNLIYENLDDFCKELLYKTEITGVKEIQKTLSEMMSHIGKLSDYGIDRLNKLFDEYEELTKEDGRWVLIKPILEGIKGLKFEDVYDFDLDKVNDTFNSLTALMNMSDKLKDEVENMTGYGGRLMTLGLIDKEDIERLNIYDFNIEDEELIIINNTDTWNLVIDEVNREMAKTEADVEVER